MKGQPVTEPASRVNSIDQFRGFAVISMILVNYLALYQCTPAFLKHAKPSGITFADLVAPFFLFILGMMFRRSLLSRIEKDGKGRAYLHAVRRYALLVLIGMAGGCAGKMKLTFDWGILQAIGLAGIIALPVIAFNIKLRALSLLVILSTHHFLLLPYFPEYIKNSEQGGPAGALAWSAMIILASMTGDFFNLSDLKKSMSSLIAFGVFFTMAGLASHFIFPVSKPLISVSYIFLSCGVTVFVFVIFLFVVDIKKFNIPTFQPLGKNALLIFLLHYVLVKAGHVILPKGSDGLYVSGVTFIIFLACFLTAFFLDKKGLYLKL